MNRRLVPLVASAVVGMLLPVYSVAQNPSPSVAPVTPVSSVTKIENGIWLNLTKKQVEDLPAAEA